MTGGVGEPLRGRLDEEESGIGILDLLCLAKEDSLCIDVFGMRARCLTVAQMKCHSEKWQMHLAMESSNSTPPDFLDAVPRVLDVDR